jgi:hypothetical protein
MEAFHPSKVINPRRAYSWVFDFRLDDHTLRAFGQTLEAN